MKIENTVWSLFLQAFPLYNYSQNKVSPGHALTRRYGEKMTKHGDGSRRAGMVFLPLPVKTLGGWYDQTVAQMKRLGSALAW